MMRIGVFVSVAHAPPVEFRAISGHAQVPLQTIRLLAEAGHEVSLLTTRPKPGHELPPIVPADIPVVTFPNASAEWPSTRRKPVAALRQIASIVLHALERRYDVLHVFGHSNTVLIGALLSAVLAALESPTRVLVTTIDLPSPRVRSLLQGMGLAAWTRLGGALALTRHTAAAWEPVLRMPVTAIRPGIVKEMGVERRVRPEPTVLFWRNASSSNGADLAVEVFERLAVDFPSARFWLAVRPNDELDDLVRAAVARNPSFELFVYPYSDGVTIQSLLAEASCCLFPFRRLSINPQYAILETLAAGVPVVCSDVESNPEVVRSGTNGFTVPAESCDGYVEALSKVLKDPELARQMSSDARASVAADWTWSGYLEGLLGAYQAVANRRAG